MQQLPSKTSSADLASSSLLSDRLPARTDGRVRDPFDDDFDLMADGGLTSQSNLSSQATTSTAGLAFNDEFPVSTSQSQSSLAFSAGNMSF